MAWASGDVSAVVSMDGVWVTTRSPSGVLCE